MKLQKEKEKDGSPVMIMRNGDLFPIVKPTNSSKWYNKRIMFGV